MGTHHASQNLAATLPVPTCKNHSALYSKDYRRTYSCMLFIELTGKVTDGSLTWYTYELSTYELVKHEQYLESGLNLRTWSTTQSLLYFIGWYL